MSLPMEMSIIEISPLHDTIKVRAFSFLLQTGTYFAFFFLGRKKDIYAFFFFLRRRKMMLPFNENGVFS